MFENKDRRDTLLLIFMAVVTVLFLIYLFIPKGEKKVKNEPDQPVVKAEKEKTLQIRFTNPRNILQDLNDKLTTEFFEINQSIIKSDRPFREIYTKRIRNIFKVLSRKKNIVESVADSVLLIEKFLKYSFFDLKEIVNFQFKDSVDNSLKFNLFLAVFLMRIEDEGMINRLEGLTLNEFKNIVNLSEYSLIDNEIEEDFQALPIIFYFKILLGKLDLFPAFNESQFFQEELINIRDLSPNKYINGIREFLRFNIVKQKFRIHWVEYDRILSNDEKTYSNVNLKTYTYLKQKYLTFPDKENLENNTWIVDLCNSDSGAIELIDLTIQNENLQLAQRMEKLLYNPLYPKFIVLLNPFQEPEAPGFLDVIIRRAIVNFNIKFLVLDFNKDGDVEESLKGELEKFGQYVKRNLDAFKSSD